MGEWQWLGVFLAAGGILALGACGSTLPGADAGGTDGGGTHTQVTLALAGPITGTYTYKGDALACGINKVSATLQDSQGTFASVDILAGGTYVVRGGPYVSGFTGHYTGTFTEPKALSQPTTLQVNFAGTATGTPGEGSLTLTVSGTADISCM